VDEKTAAPELSQHDSAASPTKEGGLAGWTTVFGAFCGLTATFGQVNTFGSYQAYYIQHQLSNHSPSDISWIGSLQLWLVFFSVSGFFFSPLTFPRLIVGIQGLFVGRLFDAYGPKRLILLGTILTTLSLMLTSICTRYYEFLLAQGVLLGIGTGLV
jgi:MFS family permease